MEDLDSTLLDDEVYPFHLMDGLPEPRQHQVDQGIQGEPFRTVSEPGDDDLFVRQAIAGQEHLLDMDTSGDFRAGQWASTDEQKSFLRDELQAGPMVMDWAQNGYRVPLTSWPLHHLSARNNKSARDRPDFVTSQVAELLASGVLREAKTRPLIINPFSAVYSNKWRLVFDCRLLNELVFKRKVKLDDLREIPHIVDKNDFGFTVDLKSGYWQVPLCEDQRTLFGCEWQGKYYEACVLILGVSDAVFAFTQVVKPVTKYLRAHGFKVISYIDDFIKFVDGFQAAERARLFLLMTLAKCGWQVNKAKLPPISQVPRALGLLVDTQKMMFFIPKPKMDDFFKKAQPLMELDTVLKKDLASIAGTLMSFLKALGPIARLKTRAMYACIHEGDFDWNQRIALSDRARLEIHFWMDNLTSLDGFPLDNKHFSVTPTYVKAGDASGTGCYLALVSGVQETLVSKSFTQEQSFKSSTWREAFVIYSHYVSSPIADLERFRDSRIRHYTDNQGVARIFEVGSPNFELQKMAEEVYSICKSLNITLEFVWQRRDSDLMVRMDQGSRGPWGYHDEFTLDWETSQNVLQRGITLDGFASFNNRLCQRYFSRSFEVESAGTDFFQQSIGLSEKVLIHPHPRMLIPALRHAARYGCKCVVVFHLWRTLASTFVILKGGHLPKLATNIHVCKPNFKGGEKSPAFWGVREFLTIIFDLELSPSLTLEEQLKEKTTYCLFSGCSYCS